MTSSHSPPLAASPAASRQRSPPLLPLPPGIAALPALQIPLATPSSAHSPPALPRTMVPQPSPSFQLPMKVPSPSRRGRGAGRTSTLTIPASPHAGLLPTPPGYQTFNSPVIPPPAPIFSSTSTSYRAVRSTHSQRSRSQPLLSYAAAGLLPTPTAGRGAHAAAAQMQLRPQRVVPHATVKFTPYHKRVNMNSRGRGRGGRPRGAPVFPTPAPAAPPAAMAAAPVPTSAADQRPLAPPAPLNTNEYLYDARSPSPVREGDWLEDVYGSFGDVMSSPLLTID